MRRLRRSAARLARWWVGEPSPVEWVGRVVVLSGLIAGAWGAPRPLDLVLLACGFATIFVGWRRRQSAGDARAGLVLDGDEDR